MKTNKKWKLNLLILLISSTSLFSFTPKVDMSQYYKKYQPGNIVDMCLTYPDPQETKEMTEDAKIICPFFEKEEEKYEKKRAKIDGLGCLGAASFLYDTHRHPNVEKEANEELNSKDCKTISDELNKYFK